MFTMGYDKSRNCLVGVYKGMYSDEILTACADQVKSASARHPCKRFVMDMRQADMLVARIDFNRWYKVFYDAGLDRQWKKAVLLSNADYAEIQNEGKLQDCEDMNLFGDIKAAVQWLLA